VVGKTQQAVELGGEQSIHAEIAERVRAAREARARQSEGPKPTIQSS